MGVSLETQVPYIGFPSLLHNQVFYWYLSSFSLGSIYFYIRAVCETCLRDRGIDWLCMKHISEIGVLIGCV